MNAKFVEKNGFTVVGIEGNANMQNSKEVCPRVWDELLKRTGEIQEAVENKTMYGVCIMINDNDFSYLAGVEVKRADKVPEGMVSKTVANAKYASFTHKGSVMNVGDTYERIMNDWLPRSGEKIDMKAPTLEVYDERFTNDENSLMEIWMPLKS